MKNIQIIDGADNSIFEIYEVEDDIFNEIFVDERDVLFVQAISISMPILIKKRSVIFGKKYIHVEKTRKKSRGFMALFI